MCGSRRGKDCKHEEEGVEAAGDIDMRLEMSISAYQSGRWTPPSAAQWHSLREQLLACGS